jgi:hypothetical protein
MESHLLNTNQKNKFKYSTPTILKKKLKKTNIRKIEFISSDTGRIKHFPPASQEWYNSVYSYKTNYTMGLPVTDKNLMKLLKGYFNMFIDNRSSSKIKSKSLYMLQKRRSSKRIFVGRGELKHTNSKVIITFYVHNTEKLSLKREYIRLYESLFNPTKLGVKPLKKGVRKTGYLKDDLVKYITLNDNGEVGYNRPFTLDEFLESPRNCITKVNHANTKISPLKQSTYYEVYFSIISLFISNLTSYVQVLTKYYEYLTNLVKLKVLNNDEKYLIFINKANSFFSYTYPKYNTYKNVAQKRYLEDLNKLRYLLKFNNVKFENPFITKLTRIVEKLYSKKVEFNIVNLKKVHLNSDILTQAIVLKLKNKKNSLIRVLRSSLNKVNLPNVSRLGEKSSLSNKNEYFINKVRNTYINNMFKDTAKIDPLNELLLNFFPSADKLEVENNQSKNKSNISLRNFIFKQLKHFKLGGVRLEAKGRLSRRFTAARSVFQLSWKGGLKNVDSSFKGLSTVMLRGDAKSNVEYSMLKSKHRIGAFGIKGWVSSK